MKRLFAIFLLFFLMCTAQPASAEEVNLTYSWTHSGLDINGSTETLAGFDIYINGELFQALTDPDQRAWNGKVNTSLLKEGLNAVQSTAKDKAGNISELSNVTDYIYDSIPPEKTTGTSLTAIKITISTSP
jgi:hypothetical protein